MKILPAVIGTIATMSAAYAADNVSAPPPVWTSENSNFFERLFHGYADEFGKTTWPGPADPNAPPSRRSVAEIPPAPQATPPYPFTDWPFGGSNGIGIATPNAVDSPFMRALSPTPAGKALEDAHIQVYGWVNAGGNVSTARTGYNGNAPVAYAFTPDLVHLDQAVVYVERVPDTVQTNHVDWGFRIAPIYGENYRYTAAYGAFTNPYIFHNHYSGFDVPMAYGEVYIPQVAAGMTVRVGRFISVPDIEAQLAPNNYMYTHSLMYSFDNYTNTGVLTSVRVNRNVMVQFGVTAGTETFPWQSKTISLPNGYVGARDPGTQPSVTACVQLQNDAGTTALYPCVDAINNGIWGFNNLQWFGSTFYHKFSDDFHVSAEAYYLFQRDVKNSPAVNPNATGYAGTPWEYMANPPNLAQCGPTNNTCSLAKAWGLLAYWNYKLTPLDNLTLRTEFYNDENGQRTGHATRYVDVGLGLQHWFSPQIEIRPEVTYYHAFDNPAFDNGTKHSLLFAGGDVIFHF